MKKEIRIGNLVDWNGEIAKISQLLELEVGFKCGESDLYRNIKPIQLTEEWLVKFGFSKMTDTIPYNYRIHKSKMFFYIRYGTFTTDGGKTDLIGFNGLFIANKFVRVIKHVHQLQNLYFALTGEELTINHPSSK